MRLSLRFVPAIVALLLPCAAQADIAPPVGYTEQCTPEIQQQAGEVCQNCSGAYHGDREFCDREFGSQGFERRCRARGASVWSEVWCASPEVAAAYVSGSGANQIAVTTPSAEVAPGGSGAASAGAEGSAAPAAVVVEGSAVAVALAVVEEAAPAVVEGAAPVTAVAVEASGAAAAAVAPESEPAETPGRRGCSAGGAGVGFWSLLPLALMFVRRRSARSARAA